MVVLVMALSVLKFAESFAPPLPPMQFDSAGTVMIFPVLGAARVADPTAADGACLLMQTSAALIMRNGRWFSSNVTNPLLAKLFAAAGAGAGRRLQDGGITGRQLPCRLPRHSCAYS